MGLTNSIRKPIPYYLAKTLNLLCKISSSDRVIIEIARMIAMKNKPRAQRHLSHYLCGGGKSITIDTAVLLNEDPGVLGMLLSGVKEGLQTGWTQGKLSIPQWSYANSDWLYALGGIKLNWKQEEAFIVTSFVTRYRWHPQETRITQRVHQAAENLKRKGAAEFTVVGTRTKTPVDTIVNFKGKKTSPPKRFYLL